MKTPQMNIIPDKKKVPNEYVTDSKSKTREIDPRPEFQINADEFPDIKEWSVGKKYKLEIEVEMTGSRIGEYGDDKDKLTGTFKISGIMSDEDKDDAKAYMAPKAMMKKK